MLFEVRSGRILCWHRHDRPECTRRGEEERPPVEHGEGLRHVPAHKVDALPDPFFADVLC